MHINSAIRARASPQWLSELRWQAFPDELHVSLFPRHICTLCLHTIVSSLWLCRDKGVCMFRCNLPAEWPEPFICYRGYMGGGGGGGNKHKKKSAQKVNSGEENSPSTPTRNQSHDLSIMSAALHQLSYLGPLHLVQWASYSPATFMKAWSPEAHWRLVVYTGTVSGIPLSGDKPKNKPLKTISFCFSQLVVS